MKLIASRKGKISSKVPESLRLFRFASVEYRVAWRWQQETASFVRRGGPEALALLEHPPVYTFGRRVRPENLLVDAEDLRLRGADVIESDRGGDITFHGPGQIVGYPIVALRRHEMAPGDYVHALEEMLIGAIGRFGVRAERMSDRPGVWVDGAKIAALGVRVQGGVTTHGFALNLDTDLAWFAAIVPCGIRDAGVTSLERVLGFNPGRDAVEETLVDAFSEVFGVEFKPVSSELEREPILSHGS